MARPGPLGCSGEVRVTPLSRADIPVRGRAHDLPSPLQLQEGEIVGEATSATLPLGLDHGCGSMDIHRYDPGPRRPRQEPGNAASRRPVRRGCEDLGNPVRPHRPELRTGVEDTPQPSTVAFLVGQEIHRDNVRHLPAIGMGGGGAGGGEREKEEDRSQEPRSRHRPSSGRDSTTPEVRGGGARPSPPRGGRTTKRAFHRASERGHGETPTEGVLLDRDRTPGQHAGGGPLPWECRTRAAPGSPFPPQGRALGLFVDSLSGRGKQVRSP